MIQVIRTILDPEDVFILGDSYSGADVAFMITDDYTGFDVKSPTKKVSVQSAGGVYIYTRTELQVLQEEFGTGNSFGEEWDSDSDWATILYDFQGHIMLEVRSYDKDVDFDYKPGEYLWDMVYERDKYYYDAILHVGVDTNLSDTLSIQDALSILIQPINNHREQSKLASIKSINMPVLSYCAIPQELTYGSHLQECGPDCYVEVELGDEGKVSYHDWIRKIYPELIGIKFLIHIDY